MNNARFHLTHHGRHRKAFTLVEVILAGTFSAMACTAAAMLTKVIHDTAATGAGKYEAVMSTAEAVACMDLLVGGSRLLGYRDNSQVLLWRQDENRDGQISAAELSLLRYNATNKSLEHLELYFPPGTSSNVINSYNVVLSPEEFVSTNLAVFTGTCPYVRTRTLLTGLSQARFWLDKSGTAAQIVQVTFTTSRPDGSQAHCAAMSPRSPMWNLMQ